MSNANQWNFEELPNSKIIITEDVYYRLTALITRTAALSSEHSSTLFGSKLDGGDYWLINEINSNEDYVSRGNDSLSPYDYSVSSGKGQALEVIEKLNKGPGAVIIDVHTHPSGLTDQFRFMSQGDADTYVKYNDIVADKGGTFFAGLIGCDRVNGNMTFSIIWYNRKNNKFYRVQDIYLRRSLPNGDYRDFPFVKYGNTQLIMQSWGVDNLDINKLSEAELTGIGSRQ